jgi:GxxExxY protein
MTAPSSGFDAEDFDAKFAKVPQNPQKSREDELSNVVIGCAIEVQRQLGPGLLESAYAGALAVELAEKGLSFERETPLQASYKGKDLGIAYRTDFIVDGCLLLELKAVEALAEPHRAQVLTYLRLANLRLGLLLNFNAFPVATRGLTRVVNHL